MKLNREKIKCGDKFGKWTVLEDEKPQRKILCKCDCGTIREVNKDGLLEKRSASCGCVAANKSKERNLHKLGDNKIEIYDDYAKVYMKDDDYFIIDTEDVDKIKLYSWHRNPQRGNYVIANKRMFIDGNKHGTIHLARYIMNCPKDMIVDHINGNISDNRKINLRICNATENGCNRISKKQHKGVYHSHDISHDSYFAYVSINGKRYSKNFNIKSYPTKEEAYKAACEWQEKMTNELHGEFSVYNSRT
jgi:hypothetical protein